MLDSLVYRSDYGEMAKIVHSTCASIATIFLFSRVWARKTQYKGLWWDDYLLIASWALLVTGNGANAAAPSYGFNLTTGTKHGWRLAAVSVTLFYLSGALSKTAFAATLLRIAPPGGFTRAFLYVCTCILWLFSGACAIFTWMRICAVTSGQAGFQGRCVNTHLFLWVHIGFCIFTIISDLILAYLPWRILGKVSIPSGEKLGVGLSMSLIGVSAILAIVRAILGSHVANIGGTEREDQRDWTYGIMVLYCLQQAEITMYIVAQAIPLLRVLYLGEASSFRAASINSDTAARQSGKGKSPATAQDLTSEVDIELVRLPTGRIVAASSEEGKAHKASEEGQAIKKTEPAQTGELDAERGGHASAGQGLAPAQEVRQSAIDVHDGVHRLWADMGLSRRAYSQSPSASPT